MGMKDHPPPREEAIRLMSENPNLIKRPIAIRAGKIVLGFDAAALDKLIG
jgi:arsenate reductase-like glutaredoxin family protein